MWHVSSGLQWTGFWKHQMLELPWIKLRWQHYASVWHKELTYRSFWFLWLIDLINIPAYLQLYLERLSSSSYNLTDYSRNMFNSTHGSFRINQHDFFFCFVLFSLFSYSCKTAYTRDCVFAFYRALLWFSTNSVSALI